MDQVGNGWRKSSYSGNSGSADCVEVGAGTFGVVVRDTTDRRGAVLAVSAGAWRVLLAEVRVQALAARRPGGGLARGCPFCHTHILSAPAVSLFLRTAIAGAFAYAGLTPTACCRLYLTSAMPQWPGMPWTTFRPAPVARAARLPPSTRHLVDVADTSPTTPPGLPHRHRECRLRRHLQRRATTGPADSPGYCGPTRDASGNKVPMSDSTRQPGRTLPFPAAMKS